MADPVEEWMNQLITRLETDPLFQKEMVSNPVATLQGQSGSELMAEYVTAEISAYLARNPDKAQSVCHMARALSEKSQIITPQCMTSKCGL